MNITSIQWFMIFLAVLGVLSGATAQMTDLFGPIVAKDIATGAAFLSSLVSAIMIPLTGQTAQIKTVAAMPGVEKITLNANANQAAAQVAMSDDPSAAKVEATPAAAATVAATAKGS